MNGIHIVLAVLLVMVTFVDANIREARAPSCPAVFDDFPGRVRYRRKGTRVVFKCAKKMRLHGNKRLDCQRDGTWDGEPPICITSGCVPFDTSSHVHLHTEDKFKDGSLMRFSCTGNNQLVGATEAFCNGQDWSATLPQCLAPEELVECDFEADLCGWSQDLTEERDWVRMMGPTQTGGTGPMYDHTYMEHKSGHYMYFETSNPAMEGDRTRLISPTYPQSFSGKCFDLWYHMQGPNDVGHVGSLSVFVKGLSEDLDDLDPDFHIDGNQGDRWHRADLQLDDKQEDFQIVIEGTKKLSYISDIALDDLRVYDCDSLTTTSTTPSTTSTQSTPSTASTPTTTTVTTTTAVTTTAAISSTAPPAETSGTSKPSTAKTTETTTEATTLAFTTKPTQQETSSTTTSISPQTKTTVQVTSTLQTQTSKRKSLTASPTTKSQTPTVTTRKPTVINLTTIQNTSTTTKAVPISSVQTPTVKDTQKPSTPASSTTKTTTKQIPTTTTRPSSPTTTKESITTNTLKTTTQPTLVTQTTPVESRPTSTSPPSSTSKATHKQTTSVTKDRSTQTTTMIVKTSTDKVTATKQTIASTTKIPETSRPSPTSILSRKTTTTTAKMTTAKATTSASTRSSTAPKSTGKSTDKIAVVTTGKVSTRVTVSTPNVIDKNITDTSNNKTQPGDGETNVSDSRSQHPADETLKPLMIGLGVGIVVGLIIIGVVVWLCRRRRYYTRGFDDELKPITNSASMQSLNGQYYADEYHDNEEIESES